jgi:hypothetical protein
MILPALVLLFCPFPASGQTKAENKWLGTAGDGKWETAGNWSQNRTPQQKDDVVIPPNSGTITVNGAFKEINSLDMQTSAGGAGSTLTGDGSAFPNGTSVRIFADKRIYIGSGNVVAGADGPPGGLGGGVYLHSGLLNRFGEPGDVTNDGTIRGGKGGAGPHGGEGGGVTVKGDNVYNHGTETGGAGGASSGPGNKGGTGGSVENNAEHEAKGGVKTKGAGGSGPGGKGADGTTKTVAPVKLTLAPGDNQRGETVSLVSAPGGSVTLVALAPGQVAGESGVCIDGGSMTTPIDLRGNPPGINVIVADPTGTIRVRGNVLLDPGVTLADITEPDAIVSPLPCAVAAPGLSPWALGLLLAGLSGAGALAVRRRRTQAR